MLIYSQQVKQHIFDVSQRWLDPNGDGDPSDGVDGFRLDVAAEVGLTFGEITENLLEALILMPIC